VITLRARAAMAGNHGLLTLNQAKDAGMTLGDVRRAVREGALVSLRRGVYADADVWHDLDRYRGQPILQARAALTMMQRRSILSHDTSALVQGLEVMDSYRCLTHVTREGFPSAWTSGGVRHHLARFAPEQVLVVDGFEVLDRARTAVDIARDSGFPAGVVACDSAMRSGVTRHELIQAYSIMKSWPGVRSSRAAVDFADPSAANGGESLHRILVAELGLPEPIDPQFPIQTPRGLRIVDIRVGRHLFEFHGTDKLLPIDQGGLSADSSRAAIRAEQDRATDLRDLAFGLSDTYAPDLRGTRRVAALERLAREYAVTVERFGTEVPSRMLEFAARYRADRRTA
jgi:hypothetical protein